MALSRVTRGDRVAVGPVAEKLPAEYVTFSVEDTSLLILRDRSGDPVRSVMVPDMDVDTATVLFS